MMLLLVLLLIFFLGWLAGIHLGVFLDQPPCARPFSNNRINVLILVTSDREGAITDNLVNVFLGLLSFLPMMMLLLVLLLIFFLGWLAGIHLGVLLDQPPCARPFSNNRINVLILVTSDREGAITDNL